jgi:hypothetical protein
VPGHMHQVSAINQPGDQDRKPDGVNSKRHGISFSFVKS